VRLHTSNSLTEDANDKPYKCPDENCEADFTRSDLLKRYVVYQVG
jgi:hypothetical protein